MTTLLDIIGLMIAVYLGTMLHDFTVAVFLTVRGRKIQAARAAEVAEWEANLDFSQYEERPDLKA